MKTKILYGLAMIVAVLVVVDLAIIFYNPGPTHTFSGELKKFSSDKELIDFIAKSSSGYGGYYESSGVMKSFSNSAPAAGGEAAAQDSGAGEC
jgi:hypothetical protein